MKTFLYHNSMIENNKNSYIKGKNDFSKYSKNNLTYLNDLSFDYPIKIKKDKKQINENLSYFKKVIDRTFNSITNENLSINIPLNNISDFNEHQINTTNQSLDLRKRSNSSKIIKLKNNNHLSKYYINKNYNKVFGEEGNQTLDKTVKLVYQISKMKKKFGNSENIDLMNRPKVHIKEPKIINDYNDISISIQRKFNRLSNLQKRNLNNMNTQNNISNFDYNNKKNNNLFDNFLSLKKRQNSNPNFTIKKNNNLNKSNINLLNDYYNEREIDEYKKSFYSNKLRNYIVKKYTKKNK